MTLFHFVRHGAVDNPNKLYYGRLPGFPLSPSGRQQARQAAASLRSQPIAAIFSGPLLRTRQTAAVIAADFPSLKVHVSASLQEVYSPFDGLPASAMLARDWDAYSGTPAPYEQPADVLRRTLRFIYRVLQQYSGQQVVAVTHMDPIQWVTLWALNAPVTVESRAHFAELGLPPGFPALASLTTLAWQETGQAALISLGFGAGSGKLRS